MGAVRDSTGAVIQGATVVITNQDTGETREAKTSASGEYRFDAISPGPYTIKTSAPGFETQQAKGVDVAASIITPFDPKLAIGTAINTVEVQANTSALETETGQMSSTISSADLRTLPIFSLNPVELAKTVPGVSAPTGGTGFGNGQQIIVNGTRTRDNNYLIDGQDINDNSIAGQAVQPTIPDMYSSVAVLTHAYTAEYGRGGGGVVNLITKSGTNNYHGSAWDLYSGSGLNALNGQQRQLSHLNRGIKARTDTHQYGFTFGGYVPGLRDKLFGFGGTQFSRTYGKTTPATLTLPDANGYAALNAVGGAPVTYLDQYLQNGAYLTSGFAIGGASNAQDIGPRAACPTISKGANGDCIISTALFTRNPPATTNQSTQWTYKVDWTPRAADTFTVRYLHSRNLLSPDFFNFNAQLPGFDTNQGGPSEQGAGTWVHVFSPGLTNEFRASETRIDFKFGLTPQTSANPLALLPYLSIGGLAGMGVPTNIPQGRGHDIYQFQDAVAYTAGRHTLRIGADVGRQIVRDFIPFVFYGQLTYTPSGSFGALYNFVDNYLGPNGSATINYGNNRVDSHQWVWAAFAQDDWKATPDLTVNLGLRYEFQTNPENAVQYPAIDENNPFAPINTVIKVKEDRNNFGPRVGFAYNPHKDIRYVADGKTVYRGAFGVFYDVLFTNITDNSQASAPNASAPLAQISIGRGVPNALTAVQSLSPVISPFNSVQLTSSNLRNPEQYHWNLGLEREIPLNLRLGINYVGGRGTHLYANQQFNYFDYNTGLRLNTTRGAIIARDNGGDSVFHSLQIDVARDFIHGFSLRANYNWSKLLDNASEVFNTSNQATSYAANLAPGGRSTEWGPSAYDHRNFGSFTYVWALPGAHSENRALDGFYSVLTRHWTVSGITQLQSGSPGTWNFAFDSNGDGSTANDRPIVANPKARFSNVAIDGFYLKGGKAGTYYDVGTYAASKTLVQADLTTEHFIIQHGPNSQFLQQEIGRDSYQLPGVATWNVGLQKDIPVHPVPHFENLSFQLRAEAQDIANHNNVTFSSTSGVNYLSLSSLLNSSNNFMKTSVYRATDGRVLRFWMKLVF